MAKKLSDFEVLVVALQAKCDQLRVEECLDRLILPNFDFVATVVARGVTPGEARIDPPPHRVLELTSPEGFPEKYHLTVSIPCQGSVDTAVKATTNAPNSLFVIYSLRRFNARAQEALNALKHIKK